MRGTTGCNSYGMYQESQQQHQQQDWRPSVRLMPSTSFGYCSSPCSTPAKPYPPAMLPSSSGSTGVGTRTTIQGYPMAGSPQAARSPAGNGAMPVPVFFEDHRRGPSSSPISSPTSAAAVSPTRSPPPNAPLCHSASRTGSQRVLTMGPSKAVMRPVSSSPPGAQQQQQQHMPAQTQQNAAAQRALSPSPAHYHHQKMMMQTVSQPAATSGSKTPSPPAKAMGAQHSAPAPSSSAGSSDPLGPGVSIDVDGVRFTLTAPLGEGSFGTVWAASDKEGSKVAIKEIPCRSDRELRRIMEEGRYLRLVETELRKWGSSSDLRVPRLVAADVERNPASSKMKVRLVMSEVPGIPLEQFLETRRRSERAKLGSSPSERALRQQVADACRYTGELLVQLAPTLENFSNKFYHRDVTPRNILIQEQGGKTGPRFSLVDFGLAVDAIKWRSASENSGDLGGDGRYWPASAWFVFSYGVHDLQRHPSMLHEYRTCLDVHSLGLTSLRSLLEMIPSLDSDWNLPGASEAVAKLKDLKAAWARYWSNARRFWQPVFDAFRTAGDFEALRAAYISAGVHRIVSSDIRAIRTALQEAREACRSMTPDSGLAGIPALFDALLLMLQAAREGRGPAGPELAATSGATTPAGPTTVAGGTSSHRSKSEATVARRRAYTAPMPQEDHFSPVRMPSKPRTATGEAHETISGQESRFYSKDSAASSSSQCPMSQTTSFTKSQMMQTTSQQGLPRWRSVSTATPDSSPSPSEAVERPDEARCGRDNSVPRLLPFY